ncbi:MAG: lipoprotein [Pseudomonadota bacterium]
MIRAAIVAMLALALGLSGCGKKGDPEPPATEEDRQG